MEIFQLREFTTLVKTLSFSETSYLLNISDSALSRHIQQLEKEIGEKLFDRTTRSITLTEYGKEFLPYAFKILKDYDDGIEAINNLRDITSGSFKLGAYYSIDEYDISDFVSGFIETNSRYNPILNFGNLEDLENGYMNKQFNVYTSVNNPEVRDFNFLKIGEAHVKAVVSESSKFKDRTTLTLKDLQGVSLFLPGTESPFSKSILREFDKAGINNRVMYHGRFEDSIEFIKRTDRVGLFYFRTDMIPERDGLKIIDLVPEIKFEYGISYRDNLNAGERAFINYMNGVVAEMHKNKR